MLMQRPSFSSAGSRPPCPLSPPPPVLYRVPPPPFRPAPPPRTEPTQRPPFTSGFMNPPCSGESSSVAGSGPLSYRPAGPTSASLYGGSAIYNPPLANPLLSAANPPFEKPPVYNPPRYSYPQAPYAAMKGSPYGGSGSPAVPPFTASRVAAADAPAALCDDKDKKHQDESKILFADLYRTLFTANSARENFSLEDFEALKQKILTGYSENKLSLFERDMLYQSAEEKSCDLKVERDFEKGYPEMITFHYFGKNNEDNPEDRDLDLEILCKDGIVRGNKDDLGTASSVFYNAFHDSINVVHCTDHTKREIKNFVMLINKGVVAVMKTLASEFYALLQGFKVGVMSMSRFLYFFRWCS